MNSMSKIIVIPEMGFFSGEAIETKPSREPDSLAYQMQTTLVPPLSYHLAGLEAHGRSLPKDDIGGDLMDVVASGDEVTAYVADVSGHGFRAGVLMGMVKTAVRYGLLLNQPLIKLVDDLNRVLPAVKEPNMYVTLGALRFNGRDEAEYVSAGHVPLLHYRHRTGEVIRYCLPQLPLGLMAGDGYASTKIPYEQGDIFAMVTDGILERGDEPDLELGLDRLAKLIRNNARASLPDMAALILRDLAHCGKQHDDETVLLLKAPEQKVVDKRADSQASEHKPAENSMVLESMWTRLLDDLSDELSRE